MTNNWYASDLDQAYRPSYAKICHSVVRHIQVHLASEFAFGADAYLHYKASCGIVVSLSCDQRHF